MELFGELVTDRLGKTIKVCHERGDQYGDTLRNCQCLIYLAVEKELAHIPPCAQKARALTVAGLCDIKYQRFEGGWRIDNIDDGINYQAVLPALVELAKAEGLVAMVKARLAHDEMERSLNGTQS